MENIVIVDAFSTGVNFIEDIMNRGFKPVVLWSKRSGHIFDLMAEVRKPIEHKYKDSAEFIVECDTYDETLSMVKALAPKFILPGADLGVELSVRLAADLGLPGNRTERLPAMTNKFLMHQKLIEHGVRGIRGKIVHNWDETLEYYRRGGFKGCVLKPYRGASSVDVRICDSEEELKNAYDEVFAEGNYMGGEEEGMLLQERIVGTEYIVNTVSYAGRHKISALWKHSKKKVAGGGMVYNYTETLSRLETGCTSLIRYAFDVLNALGVEYGNVHSEFMIDEKGPVLIEVNCRPMGSDMSAEFLDKIWGHHETDLALDAFLYPDAFCKETDAPFRPLAKGLKKHLITDKEREILSAPILPIIRRQKSFVKARLGKAVSDRLARTVDLDTSAGVVYLANEDERQLIRDRDFLERAETRYFEMLFTGGKRSEADRPQFLPSIREVILELQPVGSVLLCSNETKELPGVSVVSEDTLPDAPEGFSYAILDLAFRENEDLESMAETFFTLADKVKASGRIIVPENTYWHFPCGAESIEILSEAAGLFIEAPTKDIKGIVMVSRR
ncbi:MAG: ATP-grasp domain-containing protein [Lachnospiraceae bacterium]|nr:ATP-grasp domain-containing protein [Lachnospiraceae bacterium]